MELIAQKEEQNEMARFLEGEVRLLLFAGYCPRLAYLAARSERLRSKALPVTADRQTSQPKLRTEIYSFSWPVWRELLARASRIERNDLATIL